MPADRLVRAHFARSIVLLAALLTLITGCGTWPFPGDSASATPSADRQLPPVQAEVWESADGNDTFGTAQFAILPDVGEIRIYGTVEGRNDVDVFDLGPARVGELVVVEVTGNDGLNTVAALFDMQQEILDVNDDRSYYAGNLNPFLAVPIRQDTVALYLTLAVSRATYFGNPAGRYDTGSYSVGVRRTAGNPIRMPTQQVVWLDFAGGASVQFATQPAELMRPFSAESISSRFTGSTGYLIDLILDKVRIDYADYDVVFYDSVHNTRPTEQFTTLYFGNYNASFLGLADNVDAGNNLLQQKAIVYTENIRLFENLVPSIEEVALAIANVASHELGHLLGLEHAAEPADVMATAASARQVLETDRAFIRSRLDGTVFPIGFQNGVNLLTLNVGRSETANSSGSRTATGLSGPTTGWRDEVGLSDIAITPCSRCVHDSAQGE